jgi:hypothetical protein
VAPASRQNPLEHAGTIYLSTDNLHMNEVGHRCMAEQLARAIVGGPMQIKCNRFFNFALNSVTCCLDTALPGALALGVN